MLDREVKRGSTEMLILALVEDRPRHGYEIAKLIERRSEGVLQIQRRITLPTLISAGEARSNSWPLR
jgi:PadR family transcriptional regulator, regulatory protein PadR